MNRPTPQEQAENMLAGLKNTYQAVAKRHVHPWYSWGLMAVVIGFVVGVVYVANQQGRFDASMAAQLNVAGINGAREIDSRVRDISKTPIGIKIEKALREKSLKSVVIEGGSFNRTKAGDDLIIFNTRVSFAAQQPAGLNQLYSKLQQFMSGNGPFRVILSPSESYYLVGLSARNVPPAFNANQVIAMPDGAAPTAPVSEKKCECWADVSVTASCVGSNGEREFIGTYMDSDGRSGYVRRYTYVQVDSAAEAQKLATNLSAAHFTAKHGSSAIPAKTTELCPDAGSGKTCSTKPCVNAATENALLVANKLCAAKKDIKGNTGTMHAEAETIDDGVGNQPASTGAQCNSGPLPTLAPVAPSK